MFFDCKEMNPSFLQYALIYLSKLFTHAGNKISYKTKITISFCRIKLGFTLNL